MTLKAYIDDTQLDGEREIQVRDAAGVELFAKAYVVKRLDRVVIINKRLKDTSLSVDVAAEISRAILTELGDTRTAIALKLLEALEDPEDNRKALQDLALELGAPLIEEQVDGGKMPTFMSCLYGIVGEVKKAEL